MASSFTEHLPGGAITGAAFTEIPPEPGATTECSNGDDDDFDGFTDGTDPGCDDSSDNREQDDPVPECSNGFDDDGDELTDFPADLGCESAADNLEVDGEPNPDPACSNGFDDDGDRSIDATDLGCQSATDLDEGSEGLPLGEDTDPVAVSSSSLTGFPTSGTSYAILSTGNSTFADDPNDSPGTGQGNGGGSGTPSHGDLVFDLVTLRIDVAVPADRNCLRVDFRFLSDEFPEYVGGTVNDAFVAEIDASNFTINPDASVNAPNNFAFDSAGNLVSVNTAAFSEAEAAGTTYDGATPRLRASTLVSSGAHSIYLSVFDQGDDVYDSAAFVDALRLENVPADACQSGSTSDVTPPATGVSGPAGGSTSDSTPVLGGPAGDAPGDSQTVVVKVYSGAAVSGSPIRTVSTTRSGASWLAEIAPPLTPGTYTAQAEQFDGAGNLGQSTPITFTITAVGGGGGGGSGGGGSGGGQQLPPPVAGQTFNADVVSGVVTFKCGTGPERRLQDATQLPVGCRIDARRGKVRITVAGKNGKTHSAVFYAGVFKLLQKAGNPVAELRLVGKLENCSRRARRSKGAQRTPALAAAKRGRRLWGDGRGAFRTRGRRSAATVTGTQWLVEDRCDTSTLTKVTRGRVQVRDFARRRTIKLKAGESYVARPPRRGRR